MSEQRGGVPPRPENARMVEEWAESGWYPAIAAAAERLTALCPEVEFLQIKAKFGSLRFYYRLPEKVGPGVPMLAEEIVRYAEGWVDGYERNVKELRQRELHHFETEQSIEALTTENGLLKTRINGLLHALAAKRYEPEDSEY